MAGDANKDDNFLSLEALPLAPSSSDIDVITAETGRGRRPFLRGTAKAFFMVSLACGIAFAVARMPASRNVIRRVNMNFGIEAVEVNSMERWYTDDATTLAPTWYNQAADGADAPQQQSDQHQDPESALVPQENKNDGNACGDDEEESNGLCYKKCSLLTGSAYPIRTSAWTCCRRKPCNLFNMMHNVGLCSGFDVAGDVEGRGACPHAAGACLKDEELHLGMCYKKCSLLEPDFPFRFAAETCCVTSGFSCLTKGNSRTSPHYAVGGGAGDSDKSTPRKVHKPLRRFTERSR